MPIDPRTRIGDVRLTVSGLDRALAFYTGTLGFRLAGRVDDTATLTADGRTPLLHLTELPGAPPQPEGTTGLYHFAILTPSRAALGRSLRALVGAGYPLTGASDHLVSEALYLDDPDGNGIEIYRDRPRQEWPMAGAQVRMSNALLDLEGLLREAEGGSAQGLDPATCIGHIHLHVGDLAEAKAFYASVLGFDVMQEWGGAALFVSAGGYHHHIGLNTWAGVGAPPPPPGVAGLRAYTIELPDEDARAAVLRRLEAAGVEAGRGEDGVALSDPWGNRILLRTAEDVAGTGATQISPVSG